MKKVVSIFLAMAVFFTIFVQMMLLANATETEKGDGWGNWSDYVLEDTVVVYPVQGGNIYFGQLNPKWFDVDKTEIELIGADSTITSAQIPDTINGLTVSSVHESVFAGCSYLKSVSFPSTIGAVRGSCFAGCSSLEEVYIPEGNPACYTTDGVLYTKSIIEGNHTERVALELFPAKREDEHFAIPEGTTSISQGAFGDAINLKSISIPNSIIDIQPAAFGDIQSAAFGDFINEMNLKDIYYAGTEEQWNKLPGGGTKDIPDSVMIHFNRYDPFNELEDNNAAWNAMYYNYIIQDKANAKSSLGWNGVRYELVYLDDDSIPELWITYQSGIAGCRLVSIKYGAISQTLLTTGSLTYDEYDNVFYHSGGRMDRYFDTVYKLENGTLTTVAEGRSEVTALGDGASYSTKYFWNNSDVTETEYAGRLNDLVRESVRKQTSSEQSTVYDYDGILDYLNNISVEDIHVLCAYATNVDLTVSLGEEMKVSYALFVNGEHTEVWNKPVLAIANGDIISATQCKKNSIGYAVTIKGKKAGATHLTVTDGDSGASVTINITVRDSYAIPLSYTIDDVPSFVPEIPLAKDVQTNIWDCYGLYVNDFPDANELQKVDGNYLLEFNVYNESNMYGSIDVYDQYDNWLRSYPIEKYTGIHGLYDTVEGVYYLVKDGISGNILNYTSKHQSAYTRAKICVPEGGRFTISNNYLQSPGAYLYNSIDIVFTGANLTGDVTAFFDDIVNRITEDDTLRVEFTKMLLEEFSSVALNISTEFALEDYGVVAQFCSDSFEGIMTRLGIDFWGLAEVYFGVAEEVLKELLPTFIAHSIDTVFTIQKLTDAVCQLDDIKDSPSQPYVIMHTPKAGKGATTMNGVTVIPGEGAFEENAVLQVFRICDSGNTIAADTGFAAEQYELYHICYTVDNNKVQPNGKVTIKIPIPALFDKDLCDVYHQQSDGNWELVNARIEGEFIVFETDHFSLFAVVNSSEGADQGKGDSPEISLGIIGVVVAIVLVATAVVIVIKKKK